MNDANLRLMQRDPAAFRRAVLIDTDDGPKRLADVLDPWQREDFERLDDSWRYVAGGPKAKTRSFFERPRGHSKTADLALMALWALAFSKRSLSGFVCAASRDQAKLSRTAVSRLCRMNPWLMGSDKEPWLDIQSNVIVNRQTDSTLTFLSSDAPGSYGLLPDFVLCDELAQWDATGELWNSMLSAAAKRKHCLLSIITNAGALATWQSNVRELARESDEWIFSSLDGVKASWISETALDEQRRLLPDHIYRRLWLNQWTDSTGAALSLGEIESSVKFAGGLDGSEPGQSYFGGLDLGLSRDWSGFVIVGRNVGYLRQPEDGDAMKDLHPSVRKMVEAGVVPPPTRDSTAEWMPGTDRIRLAHCQAWKPPKGRKNQLDVELIERAILAAHQRYKLAGICYDPHQATYLAQRLKRGGVPMIPVQFTVPNLQRMAAAVLESFRNETIELFRDDELIADLKKLQIADTTTGYRLIAKRSKRDGHADRGTAFCLALLGALEYCRTASIAAQSRPLVYQIDGVYGEDAPTIDSMLSEAGFSTGGDDYDFAEVIRQFGYT